MRPPCTICLGVLEETLVIAAMCEATPTASHCALEAMAGAGGEFHDGWAEAPRGPIKNTAVASAKATRKCIVLTSQDIGSMPKSGRR